MSDNLKSKPEDSGKVNKPLGNNKPKFNAYWIYGIVAIGLIVIQFYFSTSKGPVETKWDEVKSTMLVGNDVERIVVINDKIATIYIKKDSLGQYQG